ncbi:hypothetical protein HPB50_026817 [Hyalomma asiaticum]|uniref:Uncharacterized protein n=1 Tax=Hyalomma asiaticum TaxID=266040 RepID=A0ACB7S3N4_HYAAI|nr:hypothetical protein HPB50_026817 [Hyalomma asiaticum]
MKTLNENFQKEYKPSSHVAVDESMIVFKGRLALKHYMPLKLKIKDVLSYQPLVDFINGHMLFWACSVNYAEGYRVSQALRENTYPFLAMIVLRDHRMTVVGRLEGLMEPDTVMLRLQQIMMDNEAALITARMERDERSLTQSLRQQQDEAYQASLLADQEKERRRLEEVKRQQEEEKRQQEQALQEQRRKEEIQRMKLELVDQIPEEPPDSDPGSIHLVIKLPTGTRLERRFRRTQSLKTDKAVCKWFPMST